ncbi:MAG: ATP-binding cassette domain-containing protein [Chloroflexota bacterium]|nr:ATP-binding cassette domain-containing protein [Chloroflexota bacterium]
MTDLPSTNDTPCVSFPDHPLKLTDLIRYGWRLVRADVVRLLLIGVGAGALSLAIPLLSGAVFGALLPRGDHATLWLVLLLLLAGAVALAAFDIARGWIALRVGNTLDVGLSAALWDRILRLPAWLLRQFAVGDLAARALGLSEIQPLFTSVLVSSTLALLFTAFNLALMLRLAPALAGMALSLTVLAVVVNLALGAAQQRAYATATTMGGALTSLVLALLNGTAKLQAADAIPRALTHWRAAFMAQRRQIIRARTLRYWHVAFNGGYSIAASIVLFMLAADQPNVDTATFLAFNVAFAQIMTTLLSWSGTLIAAMSAFPAYERLKPLLHAMPEPRGQIAPPLRGRIKLHDISFRYTPSSEWILHDLTLTTAPGEIVAVIGTVGSGKSTLLRLLLGFEIPECGTILYDGQQLETLDLPALRRQFGVVLQNGTLTAGTIRDAIANGAVIDDGVLWAAAAMACIANDIRAMPMGLDTHISDAGTNISGGQAQRFLLARAFATQPRFLLLDEATSALDDQTQAQIMTNIRSAGITTLMIAHRMETVVYADRVYRFEAGKLMPIE